LLRYRLPAALPILRVTFTHTAACAWSLRWCRFLPLLPPHTRRSLVYRFTPLFDCVSTGLVPLRVTGYIHVVPVVVRFILPFIRLILPLPVHLPHSFAHLRRLPFCRTSDSLPFTVGYHSVYGYGCAPRLPLRYITDSVVATTRFTAFFTCRSDVYLCRLPPLVVTHDACRYRSGLRSAVFWFCRLPLQLRSPYRVRCYPPHYAFCVPHVPFVYRDCRLPPPLTFALRYFYVRTLTVDSGYGCTL